MTESDWIAASSFDATPEAVVRYAGASGDFTPIHYDAGVLARAGYSRFFAMGMLTAGQIGGLLCRTFGDAAVLELQVRFRSRCWVDEPVHLRLLDPPAGEVRAASAGTAGRRVRCEATQAGVLIVDGEAVVAVDRGGAD